MKIVVDNLASLAREPGTVILDAQKPMRDSRSSWLLHRPARVLETWEVREVRAVLEEAQALLDRSDCVVAGYIAYEAAGAFGLQTRPPSGELPLVWLGVYPVRRRIRETDWGELESNTDDPPPPLNGAFNLTGEEYMRAVERVREYIAAGDTYQVNLACKFRFDLPDRKDPGGDALAGRALAGDAVAGDALAGRDLTGDAFSRRALAGDALAGRALAGDGFALYCRLRRAHPVPYGAYLNLGSAQILSFSPELFLRRENDLLMTRPMKGTAPRGRSCEEDARIARALRASSKNRAENVMIVDLMRNDLGRVCEIGSIQVPRLFECERYASVHQLTSTVTGRARADAGLVEILEAAFPCGSITGAPKHRTMQIIAELEKEPRGVYCGAIGRFGPGRDFALSVAIRTLVHRAGECELGVGSGITWGSDAADEWEETQMKSRFASAALPEFRLIETLLLTPDGEYAFLREHLLRLRRSARYWGFPFPRKKILAALQEAADRWLIERSEKRAPAPAARRECSKNFSSEPRPPAGTGERPGLIVRLTLDRKGGVEISSRPLLPPPSPVRVLVRPERADAQDVFLYHKTDRRPLYDRALAEAREAGYAEAIFRNRRGRLTEGCFTNLFLEIEGRWATPPVSDGLLPGIWRAAFRRERRAAERSLTIEDLRRASCVVIGNSVRGAIEVNEWIEEPQISQIQES